MDKVLWKGLDRDGREVALVSLVAGPSRRSDSDREDCRRYGWDGVHGSPSYYSSGQYDEDS